MILPRYNYTPLDRTTIDGKRHYCLPDGSLVTKTGIHNHCETWINSWYLKIAPIVKHNYNLRMNTNLNSTHAGSTAKKKLGIK